MLKKIGVSFVLTMLLMLQAMAVQAQQPADKFVGLYKTLPNAVPTQTGKKIEVLEIFYYGCSHCFDLEPYLQEWRKKLPADVEFRRMPGVFNRPEWIKPTKWYFTLEEMGLIEKIHPELFNAIHVEGLELNEDPILSTFLKKHGINEQKFMQVYRSFSTQSKVERAKHLSKLYGISGVPSIIVNGQYVTSPAMTQSYPRLLETISFLIEKSRKK